MLRFIRKLRLRASMHRSIEAELAFHREMAQRHRNPVPLGNATVIAEQGYTLWRFNFLENLWRDLAYAARSLRRSPLLVLAAMLSLGLGVGVNATMFAIGAEFLFSEPSVRDAGSVVSVQLGGNSHSSHQQLESLESSGLFAGVVGENEESVSNYNDGVDTRSVFNVFTTKNYFTALGIPILHGRGIEPGDPDEVVVLSYSFWQRYLAGDPAAVGRTLNLDGRMCTIVGILPEHHRTLIGFGFSPELYLPRYLDSTILAIYARMKPGMSLGQARAGLDTVARRMDVELPAGYKYEEGLRVSPVAGYARLRSESDLMTVAVFFALLLAVTGLVLLIACVNVAGLLLARASARRREIAIRLALGASRGRLLQQLLADSLLLSVLGAGAGLALAEFSAIMLAKIHLPLPVPIRLQIEPDWRLAIYGAFLAGVSVLACGLLPAWQAARESIAGDLQRDRRMRLRRTLVAAQVAISVVVLSMGFLFLRNLLHASALSPGFDVVHTVRAHVNLPPARYNDGRQKSEYINRTLETLAALPGIESAAAARVMPFNGGTHFLVTLTFPDNGQRTDARFDWNAVTPEFFRTLSIPLLKGRTFTAADRGGNVVVVNAEFVAQYLGGREPLGRVFLWGRDGKVPYRILGVAANTKTMTIGEAPKPQLYEPLAQIENDRREIELVMRSALPPARQLDAVRRALHGVEPMAGAEVDTVYGSIGMALLPSQVGAILMGSTGALGLLLAAIGLYGVMAFSVARRTREIGVRVAIGASRGDIARMVLADSVRVTLAGALVGLLLAALAMRPLAMFLVPGLKAMDPLNFAVVALAILAMGLLATWGPILRALRVDPNTALRYE